MLTARNGDDDDDDDAEEEEEDDLDEQQEKKRRKNLPLLSNEKKSSSRASEQQQQEQRPSGTDDGDAHLQQTNWRHNQMKKERGPARIHQQAFKQHDRHQLFTESTIHSSSSSSSSCSASSASFSSSLNLFSNNNNNKSRQNSEQQQKFIARTGNDIEAANQTAPQTGTAAALLSQKSSQLNELVVPFVKQQQQQEEKRRRPKKINELKRRGDDNSSRLKRTIGEDIDEDNNNNGSGKSTAAINQTSLLNKENEQMEDGENETNNNNKNSSSNNNNDKTSENNNKSTTANNQQLLLQQSINEKSIVEKRKAKRVFDPSGSLYHHWSMVVSLAFLYNFWSLSYRFAFQEIDFDTVAFWFALDYLADFIYLLDLVVNFHTGYLEDGVLQCDSNKISQHYRECTLFYLDCFCLLPLDILYLSIGFNSILRCHRLVKIYKFWSYVDRTERHTNYPNVFRTFTLVHYILVIFHWNACLFHMISKKKIIDIENLYKISDTRCADIPCQYLHAFYWSTLALTTVGDLPRPRTKGEYIYVIVELFFGLFLFASVLGHVANIVTNVSAARKEFQAKLDAVKTFMRIRHVSDDLQSKVIRWFDYLWISQKSSDEDKSVACLPDRLKAEIAIHVHLDTLKRVDIFQNTEAGFLCELVLRLKPVLFSPGDYVCRKNEVGHEMYIVSRGILEVVTNEGKTVVATLKAGSYFGEISVLNVGSAGNRRTASVRSVGYSDLFCLNKQDLWDVLKNYPNAEARIRLRAEERLSKLDPSGGGGGNNTATRKSNAAAAAGADPRSPLSNNLKESSMMDDLQQQQQKLKRAVGGSLNCHRRRVCSCGNSSPANELIHRARSICYNNNNSKGPPRRICRWCSTRFNNGSGGGNTDGADSTGMNCCHEEEAPPFCAAKRQNGGGGNFLLPPPLPHQRPGNSSSLMNFMSSSSNVDHLHHFQQHQQPFSPSFQSIGGGPTQSSFLQLVPSNSFTVSPLPTSTASQHTLSNLNVGGLNVQQQQQQFQLQQRQRQSYNGSNHKSPKPTSASRGKQQQQQQLAAADKQSRLKQLANDKCASLREDDDNNEGGASLLSSNPLNDDCQRQESQQRFVSSVSPAPSSSLSSAAIATAAAAADENNKAATALVAPSASDNGSCRRNRQQQHQSTARLVDCGHEQDEQDNCQEEKVKSAKLLRSPNDDGDQDDSDDCIDGKLDDDEPCLNIGQQQFANQLFSNHTAPAMIPAASLVRIQGQDYFLSPAVSVSQLQQQPAAATFNPQLLAATGYYNIPPASSAAAVVVSNHNNHQQNHSSQRNPMISESHQQAAPQHQPTTAAQLIQVPTSLFGGALNAPATGHLSDFNQFNQQQQQLIPIQRYGTTAATATTAEPPDESQLNLLLTTPRAGHRAGSNIAETPTTDNNNQVDEGGRLTSSCVVTTLDGGSQRQQQQEEEAPEDGQEFRIDMTQMNGDNLTAAECERRQQQ